MGDNKKKKSCFLGAFCFKNRIFIFIPQLCILLELSLRRFLSFAHQNSVFLRVYADQYSSHLVEHR